MKKYSPGRKDDHRFLVADSGATKTSWAYIEQDEVKLKWESQGLNPAVMPQVMIMERLQTSLAGREIDLECCPVFFYGAGCHKGKQEEVKGWINDLFYCHAEVESDMMGAARALLQRKEGIAAILGTGSNSCLYDGCEIVQQTPALGFILGDEGSGAVLSKLFIANLLKGRVEQTLTEEFYQACAMNMFDLIQRIYREPAPNTFLASWVPWLADRRTHSDIAPLIRDNFRSFVDRCLLPYGKPNTKVHFVGSVANVFETELKEVFEEKGYAIGRILKSPLDDLIDYHR